MFLPFLLPLKMFAYFMHITICNPCHALHKMQDQINLDEVKDPLESFKVWYQCLAPPLVSTNGRNLLLQLSTSVQAIL